MKNKECISLNLGKVVGGVVKKLRKKQDDLLSPYGLTNFHAVYIVNLNKYQEMTMSDLTAVAGTDKANTTRVVKDLLSKNIVEKHGGERKFILKLTENGKQIAKTFKDKIEKFMQKVFVDFTESERMELCKLLDKLLNGMKSALEEI